MPFGEGVCPADPSQSGGEENACASMQESHSNRSVTTLRSRGYGVMSTPLVEPTAR